MFHNKYTRLVKKTLNESVEFDEEEAYEDAFLKKSDEEELGETMDLGDSKEEKPQEIKAVVKLPDEEEMVEAEEVVTAEELGKYQNGALQYVKDNGAEFGRVEFIEAIAEGDYDTALKLFQQGTYGDLISDPNDPATVKIRDGARDAMETLKEIGIGEEKPEGEEAPEEAPEEAVPDAEPAGDEEETEGEI